MSNHHSCYGGASLAAKQAQRSSGTELWRGVFVRHKVVPYEHKAALIRLLPLSSLSDAASLQTMFEKEDDKWLRKVLALRLLAFPRLDEVRIDKTSLITASKCQIDL